MATLFTLYSGASVLLGLGSNTSDRADSNCDLFDTSKLTCIQNCNKRGKGNRAHALRDSLGTLSTQTDLSLMQQKRVRHATRPGRLLWRSAWPWPGIARSAQKQRNLRGPPKERVFVWCGHGVAAGACGAAATEHETKHAPHARTCHHTRSP